MSDNSSKTSMRPPVLEHSGAVPYLVPLGGLGLVLPRRGTLNTLTAGENRSRLGLFDHGSFAHLGLYVPHVTVLHGHFLARPVQSNEVTFLGLQRVDSA